MQATPESEWPYATPTSAAYASAVPRITTDPDQYALAGSNMLPPSTGAPFSIQVPSRAQPFDGSSTPYTSGIPRQNYPMNYSSGVEAMPSQYGMQPTRHGPPVQMSQAPTSSFSAAELSPNWSSLPSTARPLPNTYAFETEVPSSYQSTTVPYVPSNGFAYPAGASEASSIFPGMSPLASNLPYSGASRTLPHPTTVHSSLHSGCGSVLESDGGVDTYPQHPTSRSSISSAARDAISVSEESSSTASSSPSDTHRTSTTGYGNLTYSSHAGSNASTVGLPSGDVTRRTSNGGTYTNASSGIQANLLGSSQLPHLNSSYGIQGMQGGFGGHSGLTNAMAAGGSTVGGLPPDIHHPQPQYSRSQDMPSVLRSTFESSSTQRRPNSKSKGRKVPGKR